MREVSIWRNQDDRDGATVECLVSGGQLINRGGPFRLPYAVERSVVANPEGAMSVDDDLYEWLADEIEEEDDEDLEDDEDIDEVSLAHAIEEFGKSVGRRIDTLRDQVSRHFCTPLPGQWVRSKSLGGATVHSVEDGGAVVWLDCGSRRRKTTVLDLEGWDQMWLRRKLIDRYSERSVPKSTVRKVVGRR